MHESFFRHLIVRLRGHRIVISLCLTGIVVACAFVALHRLMLTVRASDVRAAFHLISPSRIMLALAFTAVSYLALTFYDHFALRIIGRILPWRTAAIASFTSYTLSHNLGLSPITGGSARYRIYSKAGLGGGDVARVIALAGSTFWMGVLTIAGVAMALRGAPMAIAGVALSKVAVWLIGATMLAAVLGMLLLCASGSRRLSWFGWTVPLPGAGLALTQIAVAAVDLAAASIALYLLIPGADPALLPTFVLGYALAIIATLVTHVPGGLGIFEAVVIATVPAEKSSLFAALVAYRVIYYLVPLTLGIILLALHEGWQSRIGKTFAGAQALAGGLAPMLMSAASFMGGAFLLVSGVTPAISERLLALHAVLPLPFIEASHLAASLTGTGLILLAPGLYRRLDGAFVATRALLLAGAIFSLAKGIDYEEAVICLTIAGLLQWTRSAFYRRTALLAQPFSPAWLACVATVCGLSVWLGLFSYKHVGYEGALWWQFALHGDASRYMRASLGTAVMLIGVAVWRLLAPAAQRDDDPLVVAGADAVLAFAERTDAMLALTGDKRLHFSPERDAFVMYQVKGASWIVMADPVGPRESWRDLIWDLRTMADAAQGRLLLYQISADMLEIAIELGLQLVKYGEEAIVDLSRFSVQGPHMRSIRHTSGRAMREGASFEVIPAASVPAMMGELRAISEEWLAAKGHREKGFSLGWFEREYLARFDCAIVRVDGRIVAFANMWKTANRRELSVDLMRHGAAAPPGIMDYLFVNLMQWGRDQGYARFTLGLAPLSGIDARRLSPLWAKAASMIFRHGERFYGFKGLRAYKQKFDPNWEPRYIAAPSGLAFIGAIGDLNRLIGRMRPPDVRGKAVIGAEPLPLAA